MSRSIVKKAADIIEKMASASPKRPTTYKKAVYLLSASEIQRPYSLDEALASFIFHKLLLNQHKTMQIEAADR